MTIIKYIWRSKLYLAIVVTVLVFSALWFALTPPYPLFDTPYSTVLYSRNSELLCAKVASDGQWRFPSRDTLPSKYISAVIEYEDRRFYNHNGVSLLAIARATRQNIASQRVVSGGSTLTMQLIRISRGNPSRNMYNKLWETLLALRLEWTYSKREILELYAAHAPFGGNVVGVEAAAWRYFGHDPIHLSWAEAATLAVLPNSPALIHPGRGREALLRKRDRLLDRLLQEGYLDSIEYSSAVLEPLPDAPNALPQDAPHLMDYLPKGSAHHTTIDYALQQRTQQIVDNYGSTILANNLIDNAAVIVVDVHSGETLAYVGNISSSGDRGRKDGRSVDIIQSRRSTGSLLKPILYGALLSEGQILPNTLVFDTPLNIGGFTPTNYNKTFNGVVTARSAVERSLNVPIVRMLTLYNSGRFLNLLRSMGLTTLDRSSDNYGATLILGGAEGTLWEMCGLYASLARSLESYNRFGAYNSDDMHPLTTLSKPLKTATKESVPSKLSPLSPSALWFMFEAMSGVNRPEEESSWEEFSSMKQIAWKTGTSYGNRDAWAIGLTPRYMVGVWVGNADGEGRSSMTGVGSAAPIMFDVFSMLPDSREWFAEPIEDMEMIVSCGRSGYRASEWCHLSGDRIDTLSVPLAGVITHTCPYHKSITTEGVTRGWFVLPPIAEYYYRRTASDYTVPPVGRGGRSLELIYPQHNAQLYVPQGFSSKSVVFRAAHRSDTASIHWHMDSHYLGTTHSSSLSGHTIIVNPPAGEHLLTIVDDEGRDQRISFTVLSTSR